ncbi:hypothetical protein C3747_29g150 [Trypanosoma cruzi]|uniref:Uncharacterized protein n=1 Tax=Trypanosoma cruzi TaxID=5693 RepID=A0A2V2X4T4_TRYCR|nr:hypothetical protein TcBrA4_0124760 [Trypanosoma cruzi]KAF8296192.1 hypothetical protein TcYC6_0090530 [Trypanosoma cruzi]PBJ68909.1 hypothetical protein BCY84_20602 [Trypanosoma cruzi cruzi]PWV00155.1 hypothetical protein C4B63_7g301 [Trypanosoma cruzi]PWV15462.1 hypothetical protein C3747_29g150 [Trypanosoma cruzi]
MRCSRLTSSHAAAAPVVSGEAAASRELQWTPQQLCYRQLMKSLRAAYFHDRSKLFWSRHRVLVEFYKYSGETNEEAIRQLVGVGLEVAAFIQHHMRTDVERIIKHNETILMLPPGKAKKFRADYLLAEKQHDSWCKQKIKAILTRRPPPPYPFF